jgi:hypothetical protein
METKIQDIDMKKFSQYALLVFLLLSFGCETELITFDKEPYVRFDESAKTERESYSKVISIPVHIVGPPSESDVVVRYEVSGNAREGVDYVILGEERVVIIPAGEHFGEIRLQLINNSNNIIRSQDIVFELQNTNTAGIDVGQLNGPIGKKFTFTIFDDCILGGNYTGQQSGFSIPTKDLKITSEDCENYILSDWDISIFDTPFPMDLTFIDNGDNTLTIPEQEEDFLPSDLATIKGTGTVDPVTREIEMTLTLVDFEGAPEITFTLKPD